MTDWCNHFIDNWPEPFFLAAALWLMFHPAILALGGL